MKLPRFNWPIWAGFLLSVFAVLSYLFIFVRWPVTRDFPWANLLLLAIAAALVFIGVRRAWSRQNPDPGVPDGAAPLGWGGQGGGTVASKIVASILATLSVLVIALFLFGFFVASRWLPAAHGAPQVGQIAPDFSLIDTTGKTVSLAQLRTEPINGKAPKGVLLIFYRGYW
jgi:hypothetical protein